MPVPIREIEVHEESDRSWEDAAARAVVVLGRQLVQSIDSLNFENSRFERDDVPGNEHYLVEAKVTLIRRAARARMTG